MTTASGITCLILVLLSSTSCKGQNTIYSNGSLSQRLRNRKPVADVTAGTLLVCHSFGVQIATSFSLESLWLFLFLLLMLLLLLLLLLSLLILRGLWRGHVATLLRVVPYSATSFATFDPYKQKFREVLPQQSDVAVRFLAGAAAGTTATDVFRARMAAFLGCSGFCLPGTRQVTLWSLRFSAHMNANYHGPAAMPTSGTAAIPQ
ncbi:unnamed protein product, partial [Polarella glacialis]